MGPLVGHAPGGRLQTSRPQASAGGPGRLLPGACARRQTQGAPCHCLQHIWEGDWRLLSSPVRESRQGAWQQVGHSNKLGAAHGDARLLLVVLLADGAQHESGRLMTSNSADVSGCAHSSKLLKVSAGEVLLPVNRGATDGQAHFLAAAGAPVGQRLYRLLVLWDSLKLQKVTAL